MAQKPFQRSTVASSSCAGTPMAAAIPAIDSASTQVPAARWSAGSPSGIAMPGRRPPSRESKTNHDGTRAGSFAISRPNRS